jgi:NADP-dependent 3-hydroxy acid dehydrogenase YdfG
MASKNSRKIAIITGGSNGIGYATALKFAHEGIHVVVADIVPPQQVLESIVFKKCDVTCGEDVDALFNWVLHNYGCPDVLVLNAGKGIHERLTEGDPEKWESVLNLNVMGALRCVRAFVPAMLQNSSGHVFFISSVAALKPYTYGGVYAASKAALEAVAETLRLETLAAITITVVAPGTTQTGFFKDRDSRDIQHLLQDSLLASDIAEDIWYALNKRSGAAINKITTRPFTQEF